jgi:hypothetical protein
MIVNSGYVAMNAKKLPRILFNTVPSGEFDRDSNSAWNERRISRNNLTSLISVHRDSGLNTGNFFHWEAPSKIIECDVEKSRHMRLWSTITNSKNKDGLRKHIQDNFDAIVISEANFIQKLTNFRVVCDFLSTLEGVDFYLFGAGVQDVPPQSFADLTDGTADFLRLMDQKAALFGTRGPKTSAALENLGLQNNRAIGCPSLFAFPEQIMAINCPEKIKKIVTAGHITKEAVLNGSTRARAVENIANAYETSYVLQTETLSYTTHTDRNGITVSPGLMSDIYDPTESRVSGSCLNSYMRCLSGREFKFSTYYYFRDTVSWRKAMREYDIFIGDRFHGGVACMQVGKPALFLTEDLRATELASFIGAPTIPASSFNAEEIPEIVAEKFSPYSIATFRETYQGRLSNFKSALHEAGLRTKI